MSLIENICGEDFFLNRLAEQTKVPVISFNLKDLVKDSILEHFHYMHSYDMEKDFELKDERKEKAVTNTDAFVIPNQGAIPSSNVYSRDYRTKGRCRMSTYTIANSVSYDINQGIDARQIIEELLEGFKTKVVEDATAILVRAGLDNERSSLNRLIRTVRRNSGRSVDTFFYDYDVSDDLDCFFKGKMQGIAYKHVVSDNIDDKTTELYSGLYSGEQNEIKSYKPIIGAAIHKDDEKYGTHATETPLVMLERGTGEIFLDTALHRGGKIGFYGWMNVGFACPSPENLSLAFVLDE